MTFKKFTQLASVSRIKNASKIITNIPAVKEKTAKKTYSLTSFIPKLKDKYSRDALSESSSIGKMLLKTLSSPFSTFSSSVPGKDKNCLYESF